MLAAKKLSKVARRLQRGYFIESRLQGRGAGFFHRRLVHASVEEIADLGFHQTATGSRFGSLFENAPQEALVIFREFAINIPTSLVRRDRILLDPSPASVTEKIGTRIGRAIHRGDVQARTIGQCE